MKQPQTVFLHYTQEELNRNFDQRTWARNALEVIGRYPQLSKATRERFGHRSGVRYGPHPDEVLDIFSAQAGGPIQMFVHSGAWRHFTKDDYSFPADAWVPAGINTVILNFSKLPAGTPADRGRSGAPRLRLGARKRGELWRRSVAAPRLGAIVGRASRRGGARQGRLELRQGGYLVSGPYFLEFVMLSPRSDYVKLDREEMVELSPGPHPEWIRCRVQMACAQNDADEFRRQTREFAAALGKAGRLTKLLDCPNVNHFELMQCFRVLRHELTRAILDQTERPACSK
jgi:arylformamidase